jgi:hypothetical protein
VELVAPEPEAEPAEEEPEDEDEAEEVLADIEPATDEELDVIERDIGNRAPAGRPRRWPGATRWASTWPRSGATRC